MVGRPDVHDPGSLRLSALVLPARRGAEAAAGREDRLTRNSRRGDAMADRTPLHRLILLPALLTLAVTLVRLGGELMNGPPTLFNRAVGGGAAAVGIIWLVPVFGVLFARRLAREGPDAPAGRAAAFAALGLLAFAVLAAAGFQRPVASPSQFLLIGAGAVAGIALSRRGWPRLWRTLLAYGFAARAPVAVVILLGILNGWNTHYDTPPPGLPELGPLARWLAIGVVPQFTIWLAVTVIVGTLAGAASLALLPPRRAA